MNKWTKFRKDKNSKSDKTILSEIIEVQSTSLKGKVARVLNFILKLQFLIRAVVLFLCLALGVYLELNAYALALLALGSGLLLFFYFQEIIIVSVLLAIASVILKVVGQEIYYVAVGEFLFISIIAAAIRGLFTSDKGHDSIK